MFSQDSSIDKLIEKYISGTLSDSEVNILITWVDQSPEHKLYFRKTCRFIEDSRYMTAETERFLLRYSKESKKRKFVKYGKKAAVIFGSIAASVLIALGLTYISTSSDQVKIERSGSQLIVQKPETPPMPAGSAIPDVTPSVLYVASASNTKQVTLPDGSIVILNGNSRLLQCEDFNKTERKVILRGEAYFDISKSSKKFIVQTSENTYIVHGTSFNIFESETNPYSIVTLHSGKLEAIVKDQAYILNPGEELRIDDNAGSISKHTVDLSNSISWMDKRLKFSSLPLKYVASQISHKYGVKINIHSSIKDMTYTGELNDEPLSVVLRLLCITSSLRLSITEHGGEYYISKSEKTNNSEI